ncbi:MAG TPA: T9SS type A sorting domain-containing protein, partial [Hanamia sp.]|nr:T9SS type A sorting domain-containing protein [Hanamia sp.]
VANFGCNNPNSTVVYVPIGINNFFSGDGAATAVGTPPILFQPGDVNNFQIKFNGEKLIWTVQTYNVNQNTAVAQDASSTSSRCKKNSTSLRTSSQAVLSNDINRTDINIAGVAPNPSNGSFLVTTDKGFISDRDIHISDVAGRKYSASITRLSERQLKIELPASTPAGIYILRAKVDNGFTIFKIVKL